MLILHLADVNGVWDEKTEKFVYKKGRTVHLEHSLLSIAKWEEKWKTAFLNPRKMKERTQLQMLDYIACMIVDDTPPKMLVLLTQEQINQITDYINTEHTATTIAQDPNKHGHSIGGNLITSELVYCWMVEAGIEKAYETWNFSRLIKLIEVYNERQKQQSKGLPKTPKGRRRSGF